MTVEQLMDVVREEDFDVTLTGGDPLCSPDATRELCVAIRAAGYGLWIYTGYTWEEILADEMLLSVAALADVVVEGPFIQDLRDPDLLFRGSSNQRLVSVAKSIQTPDLPPVLYSESR